MNINLPNILPGIHRADYSQRTAWPSSWRNKHLGMVSRLYAQVKIAYSTFRRGVYKLCEVQAVILQRYKDTFPGKEIRLIADNSGA